jgi:hypothetical protein
MLARWTLLVLTSLKRFDPSGEGSTPTPVSVVAMAAAASS